MMTRIFRLPAARRQPESRWRMWRNLRARWRDESGSAAIEFVFVAPVLVLLLIAVVEFGAMFFVQNNMTSVARDVSRRIAVGEFSATDGVVYAHTKLVNWGMSYTVSVQLPNPAVPTDKTVRVLISVPIADAALFGFADIVGSGNISADATMRMEQ